MVRCADGTIYTGISKNVERRVRAHNGEVAGGAKYTRSRRPVELIYKTAWSSQGEALRWEDALRYLTHEQKLRLAAGSK